VKIPTAVNLDPHALDLHQQITSLPLSAGIYAFQSSGKPPHLSWSANLRRRLLRLLVLSYTGPGGLVERLRENLSSVECWPVGSRLESALLLYELAKAYYPQDHLARLKLRMPWFVSLTEDPFPRLAVLNRIPRKGLSQFGPFLTRDLALQYEQEILGLFQLRRCTETLLPSPEHPGCIYGEMNQCLRPCQCAVTAEEYSTEVNRAAEFLSTNGGTGMAALSAARERAAEETDFEQAAEIHKRIEKMRSAAAARHEVITEIHSFNGVALTRAVGNRQFRLWPMLEGYWQESLTLDFSVDRANSKSLDQDLRELLDEHLAHPSSDGKRVEHLAIFSRWYYSSSRDGEWFPFRSVRDLNYRRLVRAISKLAKTDTPNP
jgi:excinuclease UvrABC nuclease subunit